MGDHDRKLFMPLLPIASLQLAKPHAHWQVAGMEELLIWHMAQVLWGDSSKAPLHHCAVCAWPLPSREAAASSAE